MIIHEYERRKQAKKMLYIQCFTLSIKFVQREKKLTNDNH